MTALVCLACDPDAAELAGMEPDEAGGKADGVTATNQAWADYVARVGAEAPLQAGCEPVHASVPPGVEHRGAVVLFHGFTACPQQFFELVEPLTQEGFEVFLPLLPGHGRVPEVKDGSFVDDIEGLPSVGELDRYDALVADMQAVMSEVSGEHVVGGLSVGATVALSALANDERATWDRGVALVPFLAFSGTARLLNVGPSWWRMGWGPGCQDERTRPEPRAGICEFELGHIRAVRDLGQRVKDELDAVSVPLVMVGVEDDPTANPSSIAGAVRDAPVADLCFMPKSVSHSMLSRFDSPDENKFWLPAVNAQSIDAIVDGEPFDTDGPSKYEPFERCVAR